MASVKRFDVHFIASDMELAALMWEGQQEFCLHLGEDYMEEYRLRGEDIPKVLERYVRTTVTQELRAFGLRQLETGPPRGWLDVAQEKWYLRQVRRIYNM